MVQITEELVRKKSEHNECLISTLEELSLHQEDIERIEHLQNWSRELKILLLQSNLIAKIENLHKLKKLEYLNLAINNIERVENLEALEALNKLDLTLNFIGELTSIECLKGNYNLRELILTGNPCCDYPHYRDYVMATLPQLNRLDCEEIKISEKLQAQKSLCVYRAVIVQKQADYFMQRDEQKLRVAEKKAQLESEMAQIDDEDSRLKKFWDTKSEHCPETRMDIAKYHKLGREKNKAAEEKKPVRRPLTLFAPCGRPYNLNQPKLPFNLKDECNEYILELGVYKYLDTSQIQVDVESNYVRVTVKGKIFQMSFSEEINITEASVKRSQITGYLLVTMPKLHAREILTLRSKTTDKKTVNTKPQENNSKTELKATVDIENICSNELADLPELID
ncbi:PREDICTED: protein tilB [Bactrocera latifrons]|uniref:protein tilB n=1 Tax=Bactrocera latifrons TaxID=174628 RepID=UPI0008DDFD28|nr:PREDICTED: protein tilB [Bactrocera latifrons]